MFNKLNNYQLNFNYYKIPKNFNFKYYIYILDLIDYRNYLFIS